MKKVHTNKGFTMAELLIVVAIIGVLVAIAIPTFKDRAEVAKEAVDVSNLRSAFGIAQADVLSGVYKDTEKYAVDNETTPTKYTAYYSPTDGDVKNANTGIAAYGKSKVAGIQSDAGNDLPTAAKTAWTNGAGNCNGKIIKIEIAATTQAITLSWENAA